MQQSHRLDKPLRILWMYHMLKFLWLDGTGGLPQLHHQMLECALDLGLKEPSLVVLLYHLSADKYLKLY